MHKLSLIWISQVDIGCHNKSEQSTAGMISIMRDIFAEKYLPQKFKEKALRVR